MAMQRNYFTVLFFLKKSKLLKNGEAPICMRITVNGKRAEVQIKRSVEIEKWNSQKECKHSVNHVFSSPTSIINFTSKKPSYDDTRRSGRDNELLQRAQNDL